MPKTVLPGSVALLPGIFAERAALNRAYLMELDSTCLLQNFYLEAGIVLPGMMTLENPEKAKLHWGWEAPTCQLRGHFPGHWLSAASRLIADTGDAELKAKLDHIVDELARCQKLNGGEWIAPIPEKYFEKLLRNEYVWSPQYTMHKLIMGLTDAYRFAGNEKAKAILRALADWYLRWTAKAEEVNPKAIYNGEQGGMLEAWALLYRLTVDEAYLTLAHRYDHPEIFRRLEAGQDPLSDSHANASIPYAHGAAMMYEITGEARWLELVRRFWKCAVTDRDAWCTGGQNAGEYWVPPHRNGQYICADTQEFCTEYNMVRVADFLFRETGGREFLDYIERALYNGFLAQQNRLTGMPAYYLPMSAGTKKIWGTRTHDFWCCHGTMVQGQTLYPSLAWYQDGNRVIAAQFIPSRFTGEGFTATQASAIRYYDDTAIFDGGDRDAQSRWALSFTMESDREMTLSIRMPAWLAAAPTVRLKGVPLENPDIRDGFLNLTRKWTGETLDVYLPAALTLCRLPDDPETAALTEGPITLAGLTDGDCGLDLTEGLAKAVQPVCKHTGRNFRWLQSNYRTHGQPKNFDFIPLYDVADEAYTLYFGLKEKK